ncbi:MAG: CPBP family intramembrane metalloprotease [Candidatus Harrisonbacteria bacterium]|nr:CPBP family intramembrane metalloprotease [Candidatus Harrisonbacteria bacterium]
MSNRKWIFLEAMGFFILVMAIIWFSKSIVKEDFKWIAGAPILLWVIISWKRRGDEFDSIGIKKETVPFWIFTSALLVIIFTLAFGGNPEVFGRPDLWKKVFAKLGYPFWALIQQLLLQGYLTNRLNQSLEKHWLASLASGAFFAAVHFPNPLLMSGCFVLGVGTAYYFLKSRNLYVIAFAHGILGTFLKYLLSQDWLENGMRVGPGFWK